MTVFMVKEGVLEYISVFHVQILMNMFKIKT